MSAALTSVVILTRNELAYTRRCVESIERCTPEPVELVFVDNGSTDGTVDFLRGIDGATVIENDRNLGFGGGCNQGIAAAAGTRILLLNNDVVVTPGWLASLHRTLDSHERAGVAGPRSNQVAGPQQVDEVSYDVETLDGLDAWAQGWCTRHRGQSDVLARLIGFCMLLERDVVDRIGGFDLRFGLGNLEDDDFCLRAAVAGFACHMVHDSYIHHFGSRTFAAEGIDYAATLSSNFERFVAKWRMGEDEYDPSRGFYDPNRVIARTPFEPRRHYSPLVGAPDDGARAELDAAGAVLLVCCDRLDRAATTASLDAALRCVGPDDPVSVVVRIDPRDEAAHALLDAVADRVGDEQLPDVVVVEARDENDVPLVRIADVVVVAGRLGWAREALARHLGRPTARVDELAEAVAALRRGEARPETEPAPLRGDGTGPGSDRRTRSL